MFPFTELERNRKTKLKKQHLSLNYNCNSFHPRLHYILSPPAVFTFNVLLFDLHSGLNRIQSWAAGWPHHQHPPGQTLWQSAGTKPHKGHRALLQSAGNALLYHSEHWKMLKTVKLFTYIFLLFQQIEHISELIKLSKVKSFYSLICK